VVAGAGGHDAGGPLGRVEAGDAVVGAADLERPGPLEVLGLEQDGTAGQRREVVRFLDRRASDDPLQQTPGRLDVVQRDEGGGRTGQGADPTAGTIGRR
jgi:hypothetical protein